MSREWKPGDVALVTLADRTERIAMRDCDGLGWGLVGDPGHSRELLVLDARPLVVIDPENRERVERLVLDYIGGREDSYKTGLGGPVEWMQDALREYANPTPPKPAEPQGLGAVVEDADGEKWVRDVQSPALLVPWLCAPAGRVSQRKKYADIDAIRVLSEGVTP